MICNCGAKARLISGKSLFYDIPSTHNNYYWVCKQCDSRVRTHKGNKGKPIGVMANKELRRLKRILNGKIQQYRAKGFHYRQALLVMGVHNINLLGIEECKLLINQLYSKRKLVKIG